MVKAAAANSLWWLAAARDSAAFSAALGDPDAAQEQVLHALLRKNARTAFGREHGFLQIRTPAEFARRVPVRGYDQLRPWIERIRWGEPQVLTSEPVRRLVPTSGSTAARKLIPYTESLHRQLNRAVNPWIFALYREHPRAVRGVSYWAISPVTHNAFPPGGESAVPMGFDDDAAYLGGLRRALVNAAMAVPPELQKIPTIEEWRYVTALLLLRQSNLRLISVWHPSFLLLLLGTMRDNWEQLLSDLSAGTCSVSSRLPASLAARIRFPGDARRARALPAGFPDTLDHVWPKLEVVSCWTHSHAAGAAADLARALGSVALQAKGLVATEGIISIPYAGQHPLAVRSHYLEFEEEGGRVVRASELEEGREYNVILSTAGGLFRYRLDDRIVVDGRLGRTPSIRFVGKTALISDRRGEKLSDGFVAAVFSALFRDDAVPPSFAMLAPEAANGECRYTLYTSADIPDGICARLDLLLSENPHYAYCRRLAQLGAPQVFRVSGDAHAAYGERLRRMGQRLGDIKPVALSALDGWADYLGGDYVA